tara:strand:- start:59537 stop:59815 length:279 start_codon:yes stop_codon:yes gene_type:complete
MRVLSGRVLIKKLTGTSQTQNGLTIPDDADSAPKALVVLMAEDVESMVGKDGAPVLLIGDEVYYMEPREKGKCMYNEEEHFIVPIANIIAVI